VKHISYHHNLKSDTARLAGFYEAITKYSKGTVFDLGTGHGILACWAAHNAEHVIALELNSSTAKIAQNNLKNLENVEVICSDASTFSFKSHADVIICEMLDTALIDEEQIPVLNSAIKYLKEDGRIIPYGIINCLEPVEVEVGNICYEEDNSPKNLVLGKPFFYSRIIFGSKIEKKFNQTFKIKINTSGTVSGLKITTFTLITNKIICGPTPMLNPPLIIPVTKIDVNDGDLLEVNLSYDMGGGLESVRAKIEKIHS
jgi:predicted RNA methylase